MRHSPAPAGDSASEGDTEHMGQSKSFSAHSGKVVLTDRAVEDIGAHIIASRDRP